MKLSAALKPPEIWSQKEVHQDLNFIQFPSWQKQVC